MILYVLVNYLYGPERFITPATRPSYERLMCRTLLPLKAKLDGWNQKNDDSQQTKELRASVLGLLGTYGQDKHTIAEAYTLFGAYQKDRAAVNPDLVEAVMGIVKYNGGVKEYDQVVHLWRTAKNPIDAQYALFNLSGFRQASLARRTLALSMSKDVKSQQGVWLMCSVAFNKYTREIGWSFIKEHWNEILKKFPPEQVRGLASVGGAFHTAEKEKEVIAWYARHPVPYGKAEVARTLESLHVSVLYGQRYGERIRRWVLAKALKSADREAAGRCHVLSRNLWLGEIGDWR